MKLLRKVGSTSQILQIFIRDSSSTTGAGLAGLTNASSGLTAYFHRDTDTTATAISLVTMTVGTFTSSGFKEIDATNMPGWYQFCPPNTALASGAASVGIHLKGATNMAPLPIEIDLDGQVDVTFWNGTVVAMPAVAGIPDVNAKNINNVATTNITTINANLGQTQPINFTGTAGSALVKTDVIDIKGTGSAGAAGYVGIDWSAVNAPTTTVALTGTTFSTSQIVASVSGAVGSVTGAVGSVTGAVGSVTGPVGSVTGSVGSVTGNVGGNVVGSVASVVGAVGSITSPGNIWDVTLSGHTTSGTTGAALNAASSAGDPWATALPGSYGAGTAGNIVGNNLNAAVGSRMATYTQPTGFLAATFPTTVSSYAGGAVASVTAGVTLAASQHVIVDSGTVTTLTNLPAVPANWLTAAGIAAAALNGKGDWLLSSSYTAPDNSGIGQIVAKLPANTIADEALVIAATNSILAAVGTPLQTSAYTTPPTVAQNADALLGRNIAGGSSAGRTVYQALAVLRNKVDTATVPGSMLVYATDDTTALWRAALTSSASADPITVMDPTT